MAEAVLPCHTGDFSPYDSLVPALAVTETVITGVLHALGKAARDHMRHVEDTAHATGLY